MINQQFTQACQAWLDAKEAEARAVEERRMIEDWLIKELGIKEDSEGIQTHDGPLFRLKATTRLIRKIDSQKMQDLAVEAGLEGHLQTLVRWKPELNLVEWKRADAQITAKLAGAVTTKPGRPSFEIIETTQA